MAYVFVQYLDPDRVSHLAEILSDRAALPVEAAREGEIFPDHNVPPGGSVGIFLFHTERGIVHREGSLESHSCNFLISLMFATLSVETVIP